MPYERIGDILFETHLIAISGLANNTSFLACYEIILLTNKFYFFIEFIILQFYIFITGAK